MRCACSHGVRGEVGTGRLVNPAAGEGFTLAELTAVVVVVCVLAGLALPVLGPFFMRSAITRQASEIHQKIVHARDLAMRQRVCWRVCFVPGESRWYCHADTDGNGRRDAGEPFVGPYVLQRGIRFGSRAARGPNDTEIPRDGVSLSDNRVSFSAMGTCNSGTVYLTSGSRDMALRVMPASGVVLEYEWDDGWRAAR